MHVCLMYFIHNTIGKTANVYELHFGILHLLINLKKKKIYNFHIITLIFK